MRRTLLLFLVIINLFTTGHAQTGSFIPSSRFSSSMVNDLCQDKYGNIWIATEYGLNRFDGYRFTTYLHDDNDTTSLCNNSVVSLSCSNDGELWVGTNRGLDRYCAARDEFIHYSFGDTIRPRVTHVAHLSRGNIVVCTAGYGAFEIGKDGKLRKTNNYAGERDDDYYMFLYEDMRGRFWKSSFNQTVTLKTQGRVSKIESTVGDIMGFAERETDILIVGQYGLMSYRDGQIDTEAVDISAFKNVNATFQTVHTDSKGNIYFGTRSNGLFRLVKGSNILEQVDVPTRGADLKHTKVWSILADRRGNLWLACQSKGLIFLPQNPPQFRSWSFESQKVSLSSVLTSLCEGDNGMVWCTVEGTGVYGFDTDGHIVAQPQAPNGVECIFRDRKHQYWLSTKNALYTYNPVTGSAQHKVSYECDRINDITANSDGLIFFSTFSRGFCIYDPQTGMLRNHSFNENDAKKGTLCNDWVLCMMPDRNGMIWLGTASGVSCYDPRTDRFNTQGWNELLKGIFCTSVCELRDGNIVVGTEQGLYLYDRKTKKVSIFPQSERLKGKAIDYIVQSNDGDIWCSTSMGIWQYDTQHQVFISHVNGNGLTTKEYALGVGQHTDDDMIYFGNNEGITSFLPNKVGNSHSASDELLLTEFTIAGKNVSTRTVLNGVQVTDKAVIENDHFYLSYLNNTFTLVFSQLNFENPSNVVFEYRVDKGEWIRTEPGNNHITLTHMSPGTYKIEVRALTGNTYSPVKQIKVTIRAPWWRTPFAYLCYLLLAGALAGFIFYQYRREANQAMNEEKMKFLINATHDIRSPLTLIMSPLANLRQRINNDNPDALRDIDTIEHNANRILNLVNQILDVRKIDKQQMLLHCQPTDLVHFVQGVYKMFEYNAKEHKINFIFSHSDPKLEVWIDRNQFDKVITNLLSNAFKFCMDGGNVEIRLTRNTHDAQIEVLDTGIGIDNDSLKHIFDRFYQGNNSQRLNIKGTGIGLNLCKMIVDMHHGTIEAANRNDTHGTVFTVRIPLGDSHLSEAEKKAPVADTAPSTPKRRAQTKYRVLVVDDDMEIGHYISSELGRYYKIGLCSNGKEAIKELLTNKYDVVVSDVMMPEMDGFTLLRMIKTNSNISHIPVIMLTSQSDVSNRLEGLERGADAFLAKPFNMEELHKNIDNLIKTMLRLKGKFSGAQLQADKVEDKDVKGNDEQLMERIMKVVNANLSNSDFNVEILSKEVGISRAHLHRKMKDMTGITTSDFIRNIRLEQAARLLREQKVNVTQVAYAVGFSNLAHFSTIFRRHFGVAPTDYGIGGDDDVNEETDVNEEAETILKGGTEVEEITDTNNETNVKEETEVTEGTDVKENPQE